MESSSSEGLMWEHSGTADYPPVSNVVLGPSSISVGGATNVVVTTVDGAGGA